MQDDMMPPPGWEPKSDFFKSIMAKAKFNLENKRWAVTCPCCGETVVMLTTVQRPTSTTSSTPNE